MSVIIIWPVVKSFHKENIWLKDYLQIVWGFLVDICRRTYVLKDVVSYQIYRVVVKCYTQNIKIEHRYWKFMLIWILRKKEKKLLFY